MRKVGCENHKHHDQNTLIEQLKQVKLSFYPSSPQPVRVLMLMRQMAARELDDNSPEITCIGL